MMMIGIRKIYRLTISGQKHIIFVANGEHSAER